MREKETKARYVEVQPMHGRIVREPLTTTDSIEALTPAALARLRADIERELRSRLESEIRARLEAEYRDRIAMLERAAEAAGRAGSRGSGGEVRARKASSSDANSFTATAPPPIAAPAPFRPAQEPLSTTKLSEYRTFEMDVQKKG